MTANRSLQTVAAFLIGIPLGVGVLAAFRLTPLKDTEIARYVAHPVEMVEVVLICCALGAMLMKWLGWLVERGAAGVALVPAWDGQPVPVGEALPLKQAMLKSARLWRATARFRRVAAVLDFLASRRSAAELDDQLRALSDNDTVALENSYALIRLITWATPILGFLGTVLGITQSISGVSPEMLENNAGIGSITSGLSLAFDATAVALGLTMTAMFFSFLVDRLETAALEDTDRYVEEQLAHRFERPAAAGGEFVTAVKQNTDVLLDATDRLVRKQADIWARSFETMEKRWADAQKQQAAQLTAALEAAMERTLATHAQRVAALEKHVLAGCADLLAALSGLAGSLRDSGREQAQSMATALERVAKQTETLGRLQEGEAHLVRLQQTLDQNLATLAGGHAFEEAVHSLTAAVHLLTTRVQPRVGKAA